jgi:hypothetical protein
MIVVACKLPNGLDIGGFVLKGAHSAMLDQTTLKPMGTGQIGGYAITHDVPDDVWERWLRDNRNSPIVTNGLVHGCSDPVELEAWCYWNARVQGTHRAPQTPVTLR